MNIEEALKINSSLDLPSKTLINLTYTSRMLEETMSALLKQYDLTTPQFNVLRILRGQKGKPASLSCVQERMVDKNSNTTRLIDKLIIKELVIRRVCPENRRMIEVEITQDGLELLKTLDPLTKENNANNTSVLTENELIILNNLLDKLKKDE